MREIKLRAWHGGRMIYWNELLENPDNAFIGMLEGNNPAELMQYTGLKDKNGKEVFEGDLLKWNEHILEVKWGVGEFILFSKIFKGHITGMINARAYMIKSEIIGNKYETKICQLNIAPNATKE